MGELGKESLSRSSYIPNLISSLCECVYANCCNPNPIRVYATDQKHGPRAKESLRGKIAQYLERAEQLKKFLAKGKSKTHSSGGRASKENKK
jgi:hypothetical protein